MAKLAASIGADSLNAELTDSRSRFYVLDGWRGVCALLVALFHMPIRTWLVSLPFFANAWLFVDFFFVLSGFVIAHAYSGKLDNGSALFGFVIRRFGRLWPLHAVLLGCLVAMEVARFALLSWYGSVNRSSFTGSNSGLLIVQNLLLIQAMRPEPLLSWNGVSWSISVEFWAYILFGMVTISALKYTFVFISLIAGVSCVMVYTYSKAGMDVTAWLGFFRCFFGFFVGQLLYQLYRSPTSMNWQSRWRLGPATVFESAGILCVIAFVSTVNRSNYSIAAPMLFAGVIYVFAPERGAVSRLMKTRPFNSIGRYSYSIYMVHALVILSVLALMRLIERLTHVSLIKEEITPVGDRLYFINFGNEQVMFLFSIIMIVVVVAIASFTWRFIERPGQLFFNGLATKMRARINHRLTIEERRTLQP